MEDLRKQYYNARVAEIVEVHEDLRKIRVQPDWEMTGFVPGQYTVLGLGNWEACAEGVDKGPLDEAQVRKLIKRAYSFSSRMLSDEGRVVRPAEDKLLEFYIVLVRDGEGRPPGLTPRLFALETGDRLFMGRKVTGHYTLGAVRPDDNLVFASTGTGEAPHNAMIAELLAREHRGRLIAITCTRRKRDLGYLETYRELERRYANLQYLTLTTREPENLDETLDSFVGKRYVQELFNPRDFESSTGLRLDPANTHVFLCGNPKMIGAPRPGKTGAERYPKTKGVVEVLESQGFTAEARGQPGNIHFEKYW